MRPILAITRTGMLATILALSVTLGTHVRTTDPAIAAALGDGLARSETMQRLVQAIDDSDVIVYLVRGECPKPAVACVMMGARGPDRRYVRINFRLPGGPGVARAWHRDQLAAAIAHELQHAAEIAGWPEVVDAATLQAAYRNGGVERDARYETAAAIQAGDACRAELGRRRRP